MSITFGPSDISDPANPTPWKSEFPDIKEFQLEKEFMDKKPVLTQEQVVADLIYEQPPKMSMNTMRNVYTNSRLRVPHGLEGIHLAKYSLVVLRRPENAIRLVAEQRLLAFAQFDIVNDEGEQIYVAVEGASKRSLNWMRDARLFEVTMYDRHSNKILTIKREWSPCFCFAQYYCFCCIYGYSGCGNAVNVTLCEANLPLGRVVQEFSPSETILRIYDEIGKDIINITGKLVDGVFDVYLTDDDEEAIAMIETSMTAHEVSGFYKIQVSNYEDPFGITFLNTRLTPKQKALIVSAVILMDYMFLKLTTDYPHWTQFIPYDFKPEDQTREKIFTDGSKEIIITSMKPKVNWINMLRQERRCGCCRWFLALSCICCPMGWVRNGLRCLQLAIFLVLVLASLIYLVYAFVFK